MRRYVAGGRIPHAQLLLGPEGSANLALALAFVQYVTCDNRTEDDSCGNCSACNKISKMIHPDLHFTYPTIGAKQLSTTFIEQWRKAVAANPYMNVTEWLRHIDKDSKQGNITVDECRDIIRRLSLRSFESEYRFLILWLPEYLGKEGNTLLKLIEEPPAKTIFLLVAHDQESILTTIRSRTQLFSIPRFKEEEIKTYLLQHDLADEEQLDGIAFMSEGNMNRAIALCSLDETSFFPGFRAWLLACYNRKIPDMLSWSDTTSQLGREGIKQLLEYGVKLLREVVMMKNEAQSLIRVNGQELDFVQKFSQLVNDEMLESMIQLLGEQIYYIERNANPKISLFHLSLLFKNIMASSRAK